MKLLRPGTGWHGT